MDTGRNYNQEYGAGDGMEREYVTVIQAGGKGTRMVSLTGDRIPKPMLKLNGKPMLQWQIEGTASCGIRDFVIITGHLGEQIREYFGDGKAQGVHIRYIEEKEPLGSAGALWFLRKMGEERDFLLIFGDVMFELDWQRMIRFHEQKGGLATLLVHPNAHPFDSDLLVLSEDGEVTGMDAKGKVRDYWYANCVNAGIYVFSNRILDRFTRLCPMDLEKDILVPQMGTGEIFGYQTPEYVKDAGTPERFLAVCREQAEGLWSRKCLKRKQKCIFLDRDGTLNRYDGLVSREEQLVLEPGAVQAVKRINQSGYLAVVVTNQPVVARGMCSMEDVGNIHKKLETLLGKEGAYLDAILFCPHHPDKGYPEENPAYKISCNCRKPATGMIETAAKRFHIDLDQSWIIGDTTVDIQTGKNAGLKTVLILTGMAGKDGKYPAQADYVAEDLGQAVDRILEGMPEL